jgi:hypothetical protein
MASDGDSHCGALSRTESSNDRIRHWNTGRGLPTELNACAKRLDHQLGSAYATAPGIVARSYDDAISNSTAIHWLLDSSDPAVRMLARRDLLDERIEATGAVLDSPRVRALLDGQQSDGGFGVHPYRKWIGAHWRLVSLVELGIPAGVPRALRAAETVLDWLTGEEYRSAVLTIRGLVRRHASQEGNALAVCSRLGMAADPRVQLLADSLIAWQWPDGGWNCDRHKEAHRSSFHESLPATWGLVEYAQATQSSPAHVAARRAAELFLEHRLFRSLSTGNAIHREWLVLHYPPYWHYDILQALLVLSRMGLASDPRCADALEVLEKRKRRDGFWQPGAYWWAASGKSGTSEVVDWGRSGPNEMITLNALRVLRAAGLESARH